MSIIQTLTSAVKAAEGFSLLDIREHTFSVEFAYKGRSCIASANALGRTTVFQQGQSPKIFASIAEAIEEIRESA